MKTTTLLAALLALLPAGVCLQAQETLTQNMPSVSRLEIKETRLTGLRKTFVQSSLVVSPDMSRAAYVDDQGDKKELILNDKRVAAYQDINADSLRFSPDSKRLACVACKGGRLLTVADINARTGRTHHMITRTSGEVVVAVDGTEYGGFQAVDPNSLTFSPDSRKLVFAGRKGLVGWQIYVDGVEVENRFDDLACTFNPPTIRFSPDSARMAFPAMRDGKWCMVVDGKPGPDYDGLVGDTLVFSPDGSRCAYAVVKGDRQMVVLDGKEQPAYDGISEGSLVFSADGKRFGYLAARGKGAGVSCVAVVDGAEQKPVTLAEAGSPAPSELSAVRLAFSPDGSRYAWGLWNQHEGEVPRGAVIGAQVVLDGAVGTEFRSLLSDLKFSPDGKRLAYVAAFGNPPPPKPYGDVRLVVDGREGPREWCIDYPSVAFSPDSRYAVYVGVKPDTTPPGEYRMHLVVNGKASKDYLNFVAAAPYGQMTTPLSAKNEIVFTGPRTFTCAAYVHWSIVRLNVKIVE